MAERSTTASCGVESCRSSGAGSCSIGTRGWGCRAELQAALQRCQREGKSCRAKVAHLSQRSRSKLHEAELRGWKQFSQHWENHSGPEVDALSAALVRARVAASPPPVDVQVTQCHQFIDRTVRRLEELDRSREEESVRLQGGSGPAVTFARGSCSPRRQCHLLWCQMSPQKWDTSGIWSLSCRPSWPSPRWVSQVRPWTV